VEQRGNDRKPSQHIGVRLNEKDQEYVGLILTAGLADSISDAIRFALKVAARIAKRRLR
jgi:hypothetical protein